MLVIRTEISDRYIKTKSLNIVTRVHLSNIESEEFDFRTLEIDNYIRTVTVHDGTKIYETVCQYMLSDKIHEFESYVKLFDHCIRK